jgi:hypothetical protein
VGHKEGTVLEALAWGNTVEMSALMGVISAILSLHTGGGQANEAMPRSVGVSG